MLDLDETTKVAEIIFMHGTDPKNDQKMDLFGYVFKPMGKPWLFEYRFRYYEDNKAFDSDDTKKWYCYKNKDIKEGPHNMLKALNNLFKMAETYFKGTVDKLTVNGNGLKAANMLKKVNWISIREEKPTKEIMPKTMLN